MKTVSLICQGCFNATDVPLPESSAFKLCPECMKAEAARKALAKRLFLESPHRPRVSSATSMTAEGHIMCIYSGRVIHKNPHWKESDAG